jgi:hypothetical protein
VEAVWWLCGTQAERLPEDCVQDTTLVRDTRLPVGFVRRVIRHEWVTRLSDLVERRLMLLYDQHTSLSTLSHLAGLLVEEGKLEAGREEEEIAQCRRRLADHFGRTL